MLWKVINENSAPGDERRALKPTDKSYYSALYDRYYPDLDSKES